MPVISGWGEAIALVQQVGNRAVCRAATFWGTVRYASISWEEGTRTRWLSCAVGVSIPTAQRRPDPKQPRGPSTSSRHRAQNQNAQVAHMKTCAQAHAQNNSPQVHSPSGNSSILPDCRMGNRAPLPQRMCIEMDEVSLKSRQVLPVQKDLARGK